MRKTDKFIVEKTRHMSCTLCGTDDESAAHHCRSKGAGGSDIDWNLMPLCARCHVPILHTYGLTECSRRFIEIKEWLMSNDWYFCDLQNKWKHI